MSLAQKVMSTMSQRAYIATLTFFVSGGLLLATFVASQTQQMEMHWWWIIPYFLVTIPGIVLSAKSDNWQVSLIGYIMVIIPTGWILGPYSHGFTKAHLMQSALTTACVTIAVGVCGAIYPKSVESWGGLLLTALFVLILGDFARAFMPMFGLAPAALKFWDWVGMFIFAGYIFYDMNQAMREEYTLDNAVDRSVGLYLNIINFFIRDNND